MDLIQAVRETNWLWRVLMITSILIAISAAVKKSTVLLVIAATAILVLSIATLMTIGPWTFILSSIIFAVAIGFKAKGTTQGWILLISAALVVWVAVFFYFGNPFGWKGTGQP